MNVVPVPAELVQVGDLVIANGKPALVYRHTRTSTSDGWIECLSVLGVAGSMFGRVHLADGHIELLPNAAVDVVKA
jgi:hypothetical protein